HPPLRVGAFNVRAFGRAKMENEDIVKHLVKIVTRYDVMLLQEIRDATGTAIGQLLATDRVVIEDTFQYNDDAYDVFEREPFCVLVEALTPGNENFAACGIHIKPTDVVQELNELPQVYGNVTKEFNTENVMFLGDFNAECSYLDETELAESPIYNDPKYTWVISSEVDTTTSCGTNCAYDRIVITGDLLTEALIDKSGIAYKFDREYDLETDEAYKVSDHYPVEVCLLLPW
ncbi:deoxyribonuclease-1-like, partial [Patella vulgata]|uniref:deoxyribonuclease-1-like n=1 Tax=Patella vulgata TaxID=6465 RepID=UPI0024A89597